MKGTIYAIDSGRDMVAIETENGDLSVFANLSNSEFELGDSVSGPNDTGLGSEPLINHTRRHRTEVYFQNHHVSKSGLRQQLLL